MVIHKNSRLTEQQRKKMWEDYSREREKVKDLAEKYQVTRPTVYKILKEARLQNFRPKKSTNKRFQQLKYGLKRLAKIEKKIEEKLKVQSKRYNKQYPGELVHFDTKRLPLITGEKHGFTREYLFIAIDDYSRELYAAIFPDKTQISSATFLNQVIEECPYTIEYTYSDNGKEYKGVEGHAFVETCKENGIGQRFTRVKTPRTNGKAERVIRTLMEMWHNKIDFKDSDHRKQELNRFINFYNTVKPHKGIDGVTPYEKLLQYFHQKV